MRERILIVEDERITAEDLREVLGGFGYEVLAVVATGADAISAVEHLMPDLVLMDIRISGDMDGTETARILHERFDVPVVYLTAHADQETLRRAKQALPLAYVVKPFREPEMQAAIEIALHRHRQDRKTRQRQHHLNQVLGDLLLGVISVDAAELVILFNPAAEELTGWTSAEAIGAPLRSVFRLADSKTGKLEELPLDEVLKRGSLHEIRNCSLVMKNGERRSISGNISPVPGIDGFTGAIIVFESEAAAGGDPHLGSKFKDSVDGNTMQFGRFQVVAAAAPMKQVLAFALRVARSRASTILVEGESGTGKDVMARFLHYSSDRLAGPFVPVNCPAIPESLIESELFGHDKGAFTDARAGKKGLFELADGGTLFLDEIAELSPSMQSKLLRVLEDQTFRRVGGIEDIEVDVRVVAATNIRLAEAVQRGRFRVDLFHRLTVIPISLPPLRERAADIVPLAQFFVQQSVLKHKSKVAELSREAIEALLGYDWPGNVRELRNVIERAVLTEETETIQLSSIRFMHVPAALPGAAHRSAETPPLFADLSLEHAKRELMLRALKQTGGNQTKAARLLGISRDMLRHRIKKLQLKLEDSMP